jgi:hypothetical protein
VPSNPRHPCWGRPTRNPSGMGYGRRPRQMAWASPELRKIKVRHRLAEAFQTCAPGRAPELRPGRLPGDRQTRVLSLPGLSSILCDASGAVRDPSFANGPSIAIPNRGYLRAKPGWGSVVTRDRSGPRGGEWIAAHVNRVAFPLWMFSGHFLIIGPSGCRRVASLALRVGCRTEVQVNSREGWWVRVRAGVKGGLDVTGAGHSLTGYGQTRAARQGRHACPSRGV